MDEKSFSYSMADINVTISGKIDRIDEEDGVLNIIDYKTSRKKEKAENNLQMALTQKLYFVIQFQI